MAALDLLKSLLRNLWYYHEIIYVLYCVLGGAFVASFIPVFLQCRPLSEYWQVDLGFDEAW